MKQAANLEYIENKSQLLNYFNSGFKSKNDFKVGIELEKLAVSPFNYKAIPFSCGIEDFLKKFGNKYISENNRIIGSVEDYGVVSLEPGSQCEISLYPAKTLHELYENLKFYNQKSALMAEELDFNWIGYGVQPLSTNKNIELIPKVRYEYMTNYLPVRGELALVMMRETAGIQVALDFESEEDAIKKLRLSLALSPFVTAMFANSPIREGKDTGYKSFRANSWLNTDETRCGLVSKKLFDTDYEYSFDDHIEVLLDIPMIFIQKDNKYTDVKGLTFRNYLKKGFNNYIATMDDWYLHMNLFFPDVRLNSYLEIRNTDSQRNDLMMAPAAFWKGILYDDDSMDSAFELIKKLKYEDLMLLRADVPKYALKTEINNCKVSDIAKELIKIAYNSLNKMNNKNHDNLTEAVYLDKLIELINQNKTPADIILEKWHNEWNKDPAKLIEYSRIV
jgi:glutamate--cysteine ligase